MLMRMSQQPELSAGAADFKHSGGTAWQAAHGVAHKASVGVAARRVGGVVEDVPARAASPPAAAADGPRPAGARAEAGVALLDRGGMPQARARRVARS